MQTVILLQANGQELDRKCLGTTLVPAPAEPEEEEEETPNDGE